MTRVLSRRENVVWSVIWITLVTLFLMWAVNKPQHGFQSNQRQLNHARCEMMRQTQGEPTVCP